MAAMSASIDGKLVSGLKNRASMRRMGAS